MIRDISDDKRQHLNVDMEIWGLVSNYDKFVLTHEDTLVRSYGCSVCDELMQPVISLCDAYDKTILEKSFCENCSFMTYTKMPTQAWLSDFYTSQWDSGRTEDDIIQKFIPLGRSVCDMLVPLLDDKEVSILDYGCGYGNFLSSMRDLGFSKLSGFDFSQKRLKYTASLGINTVKLFGGIDGKREDELCVDTQFGVIHCNHVFEHVFDVNETLGHFHDLLVDGGLLYIAVPNLTQEHVLEALHFIPHIHHFTKENLSLLLERNGFKVISSIDEVAIVAEKVDAIHKLKNRINGITKIDLLGKVQADLGLNFSKDLSKGSFADLLFKNAKPATRVNSDNKDELRVLKHVLGNDSIGSLTLFKNISLIKFYIMKILINFDENNIFMGSFKQRFRGLFRIKVIFNKIGRKLFSNNRRVFGTLTARYSEEKYPMIRVRYSDGRPRGWLK